MKRAILWLALLCLFAEHAAHAYNATNADKATNACAASLQPHARLVFDAVSAQPQPELTLRAVIEKRTRELVFMDRLMVGAARPAAEAASTCLRLARHCIVESC
jgi:hypothetical protein